MSATDSNDDSVRSTIKQNYPNCPRDYTDDELLTMLEGLARIHIHKISDKGHITQEFHEKISEYTGDNGAIKPEYDLFESVTEVGEGKRGTLYQLNINEEFQPNEITEMFAVSSSTKCVHVTQKGAFETTERPIQSITMEVTAYTE